MSAEAQTTGRLDRGAWARRHNHALVALARQVWHDRCTLQTAYARICETAAQTLAADRVGVWLLDPTHARIDCVHLFLRGGDRHNPPGAHETLRLGEEYGARLHELRVIDAADVRRDSALTGADLAMADYIARHRIGSLLDAPIRSGGELLGVVCHEQVDTARVWTPEDLAFAASIGDYVAMAIEISRRREAEGRLRYLELHDPLTDLPNRDHLLEVAHSALRPAYDGEPGPVALHVQVEPGAVAVDDAALLVEVAARLRREFAAVATLARVRERAFALLPHGQPRANRVLDMAERCLQLVQAVEAAASVGVAFARDLSAPSADALLRNAELAAQRARAAGRNRCEVFDIEHHRGLLGRLQAERTLRQALADGQLELRFQPEVDLRDGCWRSAEALLRCRDGQGGLLGAEALIEAAESSGLIVPIGRWVLERACHAALDWRARDGSAPELRVNVSARQLEQPDLAADVARALADSGLPPSRLCLELTETTLLSGPAGAVDTLARLQALGVRIALDDFGTGYCSLAYLKRLPIDMVKLDRSFIQGLPGDRCDHAIVEAVASIACALGIEAVAEGVETQAQVQVLLGLGIVRAQGFLFARPLDDAALRTRFGAA